MYNENCSDVGCSESLSFEGNGHPDRTGRKALHKSYHTRSGISNKKAISVQDVGEKTGGKIVFLTM
jgi:hypothetical protein